MDFRIKKNRVSVFLLEKALPVSTVLVSISMLIFIGVKEYMGEVTNLRLYSHLFELLTGVAFALIGLSEIRSYVFHNIYKSPLRIFISYNHRDAAIVNSIVSDLKKRQFEVVFDQEIIKVGDNINEKISAAIIKSDIILFVIPSFNRENAINLKELEIALTLHKKIIPIAIEPKAEIPEPIKEIKYADFTKDYETSIIELGNTLRLISKTINTQPSL